MIIDEQLNITGTDEQLTDKQTADEDEIIRVTLVEHYRIYRHFGQMNIR